MPRSRNIKPSFFTDDELAETSPAARLIFIGIWTVADKEGRLKYRPKRLKAMLMPYDDIDIEHEVSTLIERGFLKSYAVDGHALLEVCNWHKHQSPHHKETESILPSSEGSDSEGEILACVKHDNLGACKHGSNPPDSLNLIPDTRGARKRAPTLYEPSGELLHSLSTETGMNPIELAGCLRMMKDHEFHRPKKDWDSVFRNWVRRERKNETRKRSDDFGTIHAKVRKAAGLD